MASCAITLYRATPQRWCDQYRLLPGPLSSPGNHCTPPLPYYRWIFPPEIQQLMIIPLPFPLISLLTHLRCLSSRSNDQYPSSIYLVHSPCSPCPLTISVYPKDKGDQPASTSCICSSTTTFNRQYDREGKGERRSM